MIKNNENNPINTQLKNINKMLIIINTDIKNNEEKINNLFCDYNNSNINYNAHNNFKKKNNNNIISIKNIQSNVIYKKIFSYVNEKQKLRLIKYNKNLKNKINITLINYKFYREK